MVNKSTDADPLRTRILTGARRNFFAYGLRGVTMDALAREIGVSKKTFYVHFPSKQGLIEEVLAMKLGEVEADLSEVGEKYAKTPILGLSTLLTTWRRHLAEIQPIFLRDIQMEAPEVFARLAVRRRELIHRSFGGLLESGLAAGTIRDDIPTGFIVEMMMGAVDSIGQAEKLEEWNLTIREAFTHLTTIIVEGALSDQGRKKWRASASRRHT